MGEESSEQEGFSDFMSEEGEKKPRGKKKVQFTEEEEFAVDEDGSMVMKKRGKERWKKTEKKEWNTKMKKMR